MKIIQVKTRANRFLLANIAGGIIVFVFVSCSSHSHKKINYPVTKKGDVVDTIFSTPIPDPYRWLEDDRSDETAAWVKEQNKVTFGYLEKIPYREQIKRASDKNVEL